VETLVLLSRAHGETVFKVARGLAERGEEVHIVFTGRGTHYVWKGDVLKRLKFARLYTFEAEFDSPNPRVEALSYQGFVELLERCERVVSWV